MDSIARTGALAPEFELKELNGQGHSLRDWRGSIVVLNFWSAECTHSERADMVLEELAQEWGDEVALWCIASNENENDELVKSVAKNNKVKRLLRDRNQEVADTYGAVATPHIFVIDKEGVLRYSGGLDDVSLRQRTPTMNYTKEAVAAVLAGRHPDPSETPPFGCAIIRHPL
ncbi:MAG: redoxin domain-containing protein [Anaerolineales bacterium]